MEEHIEREPKLSLGEWSRFLAITSGRIAYAWDRQVEEGFPCDISKGALPGTGIGWSCNIICPERSPGEPSPENAARIRVTLSCHVTIRKADGSHMDELRVVEQLVYSAGDQHEMGGGNYLVIERDLLSQWADLLRRTCLDMSASK